ncbi:MAG: crotonase/enoyl-CoA hydratase family protein [Acidimicrobiia bacterium]
MGDAVRVGTEGGVRRLTLCRANAYNTITPELRDQLHTALDDADRDDAVRVVLLDSEGPAFCAGYDLAWGTDMQASVEGTHRVWDSAADVRAIGSFASTWARLHEISKPTIAAVSGWCLAGGMNIVLNADLIVCAESARFGYPPSRVWGVPEAPWTWVARLGLERAKRFMLTGDEITGPEAVELGMVLECVADDDLAERAAALARRIALVPTNQLQMIKWSLNEVARTMYDPQGSRMLGTLFDGVARHTQEGLDFVARSEEAGWRAAVRERDEPFGDYGERR